MVDQVVLHVGAMKSGTTYLQMLLFQNKESLARQDVLVVGTTWSDQVRGVGEILRRNRKRPAWDRLLEEMRRTPGRAVISMEYLGPAHRSAVERVVASLPTSDVRVVLAARDVNRSLVSMWQEKVQNGRPWTWAEYVADARDKAPGETDGTHDRLSLGGSFWRQQHIARMWSTWAQGVGRDRCTVVTLPAPGAPADTLRRRFEEAAGLTFEDLAPPRRDNASLGLPSVLVLRQLNELLEQRGIGPEVGMKLRKNGLAKNFLPRHRHDEPALGFPVEDWVREQAAATIRRLRQDEAPLVGDWADLEPVEVPGVSPDAVAPEQIADAAMFALAEVVAHRLRNQAATEEADGRNGSTLSGPS